MMDVHVYIQNGQTVYEPAVEGAITWETARQGQPGKCSFTAIPDGRLDIGEGNAVRLDVNGKAAFFGFIFERGWGSDGLMKVAAYDQLRYLKNKDSYNYTGLTAGQVIQMVAGDYGLQVGWLADTGYPISRNEKDSTLFDIILNALDLTMIYTGKMYIFYDDVGKLSLRDAEEMKLDIMVDGGTAQDYDFKVSIDSSTYNQVKLYHDSNGTKRRETYMTKHTGNINKWGVLQFDGSIGEGVDGQAAAERYLALYNRPSASLRIKGAFGDARVRAGCLIPVFLDLRDMKLKNYLMIESVTHRIEQGTHTMDMDLRGAGISG